MSAAVDEAKANLHKDENQNDIETIVDTDPGDASEGDPKEE